MITAAVLLRNALQRFDRTVSVEDLLDAAWIAPHLGIPARPKEAAPPNPSVDPPIPDDEEPPSTAKTTPESPAAPPRFPLESAGAKGTTDRPAAPVRLPAGASSLRKRDTQRALRHFLRWVPSRVRSELDEEGTVELRAETRRPLIRFRPERERALSACLVVDRGASMDPWEETAKAFARVVGAAGAFRTVRVLHLDADGEEPALARRLGRPRPGHPRPPGGIDTVVLVLSDFCSRAWWNGSAFRLFAGWAESLPVGLIALMPEKFWPRTPIGQFRFLQLVRSAGGGPLHMRALPSYDAGAVLPIGSLEEPSLATVASLMGYNRREANGAGIWVPTQQRSADDFEQQDSPGFEKPLTAEDRIRRFLSTASPKAVQLAALATLFERPTIRTLRLIAGAARLQTSAEHHAEVLLGGLLHGESVERSGRRIWEYRFHTGVATALRGHASWHDEEPKRFFERFREYLLKHRGELGGIRAAVPLADGDSNIRGMEDEFLNVDGEVLAGLAPITSGLHDLFREVKGLAERGAVASTNPTEAEPVGLWQARERLLREPFRVGFVGQTGIGKSSLVNAMLGDRLPAKPSNIRAIESGMLFGQESLLDTLRAGVRGEPCRQVLHGRPGVAKSPLGQAYALRFAEDYSALLLISTRSASTLQSGLAALCDASVLNLPEQAIPDFEPRAKAAVAWLRDHSGWLLILDNADSPEAIADVTKLVGRWERGHVLITSRLAEGWGPQFQLVAVDIPSVDVAVEFLLSQTDGHRTETPTDRADAEGLIGGLTGLELKRAVEVIRAGHLSLADYRSRWAGSAARVAGFRPATAEYSTGLAATWLTSFDAMSEGACELLRTIAWFAPEPLPISVILNSEAVRDPGRLDELIRHAFVFRLRTDEYLDLSRSLQQATRDWMTADERDRSLRAAIAMLVQALGELPVEDPLWSIAYAPLAPHAMAVGEHAEAAGLRESAKPLFIHLARQAFAEGRSDDGQSLMDMTAPRVSPKPVQLPMNPGIEKLEDLKPGMSLRGVIQRIEGFGAYADVGIDKAGLIHVSQLANRFVRHPKEVVAIGDEVTVWVVSINPVRRILQLTMLPPTSPWKASDDKSTLDPRIDISRLQEYGRAIWTGRGPELKFLDDTWSQCVRSEPQRPHILTIVARGGEGKSTLVAKWLDTLSAREWPYCDLVFGWSFYSPDMHMHESTTDLFFRRALLFSGDTPDSIASLTPFAQGKRLAKLAGARRTILVLDGIEPLQDHSDSRRRGELRDQALSALLKGLASESLGLCVMTTRYPIPELARAPQVTHFDLSPLSLSDGAELLRSLGVVGSQMELEEAVAEHAGHALLLKSLGTTLQKNHAGDIRKRGLVNAEATAEIGDSAPARRGESIERVAELLTGRSLVLIGGQVRTSDRSALIEAFRLKDLEWLTPSSGIHPETFEKSIARPETTAVLLALRWISSDVGRDVIRYCERHHKPLVRLPAGYQPETVAEEILKQFTPRLKEMGSGRVPKIFISATSKDLSNARGSSPNTPVSDIQERLNALSAGHKIETSSGQATPLSDSRVRLNALPDCDTVANALALARLEFADTLIFGADADGELGHLKPDAGPPEKVLACLRLLSDASRELAHALATTGSANLGKPVHQWLTDRGAISFTEQKIPADPAPPQRVLVVEDLEDARTSLVELLETALGLRVDAAEDGAAALELLAEQTYSLVITDLRMPKLNGMELLKEIQVRKIPTTTIIVTGHGSITDAVEAMKYGAYDFLPKPAEPQRLLLLVQRALKERAARDEVAHAPTQRKGSISRSWDFGTGERVPFTSHMRTARGKRGVRIDFAWCDKRAKMVVGRIGPHVKSDVR